MGITAGLLGHEADILRRTGQKDRFGRPKRTENDWDTVKIATEKCRVSGGRGGETFPSDTTSMDVVDADYEVFFQPDVDIREDDTLVIRDPAGLTIIEKANVTLVRPRHDMPAGRHHVEVLIKVVRGNEGPPPITPEMP